MIDGVPYGWADANQMCSSAVGGTQNYAHYQIGWSATFHVGNPLLELDNHQA